MQPDAFPLQRPLQHPADDQLVLYLPFQEGSGRKTYDASIKGNDATLVNGVSWKSSRYGWALDFDVTKSQYLDCGVKKSLAVGLSDFTMWAWVKPRANASNAHIIYKGGNGGGKDKFYGLVILDTGKVQLVTYDGGATFIESTATVNDNALSFVVGVRKGQNVYVYVDMVAASAVGTVRDVASDGNLYIGSDSPTPGDYFDGEMEEAGMTLTAVGADELQRYYEQWKL